MKTTIPFSGFYESAHSWQIESQIDLMCKDYNNGMSIEGLTQTAIDAVYNVCDFGKLHRLYAENYVALIAHETGLKIKFESISSPREYNFVTDRIFADISLKEAKRLASEIKIRDLADTVRERFTSRDGFSSFYSNDLSEWGKIETWDHNQVGTLVECWLRTVHDMDDERLSCWLFENGNGEVENWLYACTPNLNEIMAPLVAWREAQEAEGVRTTI